MLQTQSGITLTLLAFLVGSSWGGARDRLFPIEEARNWLIHVGHEGFYMAFRVQPSIRIPSFEAYMTGGLQPYNTTEEGLETDIIMPCGCKFMDKNLPCDRHYYSSLLSNWDRLPIDKVRVGIYKDKKEVKYFLFSGRRSNFTNWFSQDRLMESSYSDLNATTPTNFFSIIGDHQHARRFFINHANGACHNYEGWLVVEDRDHTDCTEWEKHGPFPAILYSPHSTMTNYTEELAVADVMVISVKMRLRACPDPYKKYYEH